MYFYGKIRVFKSVQRLTLYENLIPKVQVAARAQVHTFGFPQGTRPCQSWAGCSLCSLLRWQPALRLSPGTACWQSPATGPSPTHQQTPELREETCGNRHPNQVLGLVQDSCMSKYLCGNASTLCCSEFITAHSVVCNPQSSLPHREGQQRSALLSNLSALCRISIPLPLPELILSDSNCI